MSHAMDRSDEVVHYFKNLTDSQANNISSNQLSGDHKVDNPIDNDQICNS